MAQIKALYLSSINNIIFQSLKLMEGQELMITKKNLKQMVN